MGPRSPGRKGQRSSTALRLSWDIKTDPHVKEDRRADRQAEARSDTVAHRISRRERGQVLAKCGSCPDAQLTELCVALSFTAAAVKLTQQLLTSAHRRRLGELRTGGDNGRNQALKTSASTALLHRNSQCWLSKASINHWILSYTNIFVSKSETGKKPGRWIPFS